MIHHTKDVETSAGDVLNKDYNTTVNFFGSPYDIYINRDGTVDLTPRWIYAANKFQYLRNVPVIRMLSHDTHFYAGIGETDDLRKDYVHIAVAGDFDSQKLPSVQLDTLVKVICTLVKGLQIDPRVNLKYHGDKVLTSCPGFLFVEKNYLIKRTRECFVPLTVNAVTENLPDPIVNPTRILKFIVHPTDTEVDDIITPDIEVAVVDENDDVVTSFNGTKVTIKVYDNPDTDPPVGYVLSGTLTREMINGVATFDDLSLNIAGLDYILQADCPMKNTALSDPFDITEPVPPVLKIYYSDMSEYDAEEEPVNWYNISESLPAQVRVKDFNMVTPSGSLGAVAGGATGTGSNNRKVLINVDPWVSNDYQVWDTAEDTTPIRCIDVDMIVRMRTHTQTLQSSFGPMIRASGSTVPSNDLEGYGLILVPHWTGSISIIKYTTGSSEALTTIEDFPTGRYGWYDMRLQMIGSNLKAKIWDFELNEPDDWMLETTDSSPYQHDLLGFMVRGNIANYADLDVISVDGEGGTPQAIPTQFDIVSDFRNHATGSLPGIEPTEWTRLSGVPQMSASIITAADVDAPVTGKVGEMWQGKGVMLRATGSIYTGTVPTIMRFNPASASIADATVLMRSSQGSSGGTGRNNSLVLRWSGSSGYMISKNGADVMEITKWEDGSSTALGVGVSVPNTTGVHYITAEISGSVIKAKMWDDYGGESVGQVETFNAEPVDWMIERTDDTFPDAGEIGFVTTQKWTTLKNHGSWCDFMGIKIMETLRWARPAYDFGTVYGTGSLMFDSPEFINQKYTGSITGALSIPSGSSIFSVGSSQAFGYTPYGITNSVEITVNDSTEGELSGSVLCNIPGESSYETDISMYRVLSPFPEALAVVYAEDFGSGLPTTFSASVGPTITKSGGPAYTLKPTELGTRGIMDINSTDDLFNWNDPLSTEKMNYAVFTVVRQQGTTAAGHTVDFRDGSNYKMILTSFSVNNTRNGWYYGQSGSLSDLEDITGEAQSEFYIRCWLFEGNYGRLFIGGGAAAKSGSFEPTALDTNLRIGLTSSTSLDIEIAHIGIYAIPLGETFHEKFLDDIGNAIQEYYSGGALPEAEWSPIVLE